MKSFIFDALKDLLPVLSGFLGILGVLNVFKKVNGRLTAWGWLAVLLIFFSTIGGVVLAKKEKSDDEHEKAVLQNKLNNILSDLAKVKQPLGDVGLTYWSVLPDSDSEVFSYKEYLKKKIASLPKSEGFKSRVVRNKNIKAIALDVNGNPFIYEISEESSFWPRQEFPNLSHLSILYHVKMCISLKKIKPEQFEPEVKSQGSVDWCASSILPHNNVIFYDAEKDKVGYITSVRFKKENVDSNGKISSVQDLVGAWVFFQPPTRDRVLWREHLKKVGVSKETIERQDKVSSILSAIEIEWASIDSGNGQDFHINGKDLRKFTDEYMNSFFYLALPLNNGDDSNLLPEK